jgi:hypothetical protein
MAHDQRIVLGVSFGDVVEIFAYRRSDQRCCAGTMNITRLWHPLTLLSDFAGCSRPSYQIGACGTGRKSSAKVLAAWLHAKKPEFYWGRQKQCEPSQSHHWAPPATIVCSEDESGGRMFLGDVAAGNSCFGRAAQEIREKAKGSAY